ncbi:aldehyde dehydrogenase family protein [Halomicroarcula sp. F13]|uniref:Aldehyde dehydrogenase family protein n=1 Tax=Haloarcula rubra TaxID=2487747 RepID=A0AAW4PZI0_9EURY|nr:aldehyde dehydrogenase family protein [Halomicroarcula rubra]MBX0325985.1 aldehyde dehydrogenase family protein [Halomicroarcula rubra]
MSREFAVDMRERHEQAIAEATADREFPLWIDGEARAAESGDTFATRDPAVDVEITTVPRGDAADVDAAVSAARTAFESEWGALDHTDRADRLLAWTDRLREHTDELARLESLDTGKPEAFAAAEIEEGIDYIEYYGHLLHGDTDERIPVGADTHAYNRKEPYGVAGLIVPWNYPVLLTSWKLGPALAAGNTVVLKPAESTPLTSTRLAQLADGILPDGTLNVVHGFGDEAGAALTNHPGVDKLSFTGEDATGELVMSAAAKNITPVTLELGGKSPFVVFPDADLAAAAETAAEGIFYNVGQSCDAFSRTLVHEDVHDAFLDRFVEAAASWTVGDPLEDGTMVGSLASEQQYEKVREYVDIGLASGAELVHGGEGIDGDGWFHEPTIFDGVDNDSRLAQEEVFGPVASVIEFADYEEAIALANDVDYGLASGVATEDVSLAHRAAADIDAGTVWVNDYARFAPGLAFGGFKRSGVGRECGAETLDEYRQNKSVVLNLD